MRDDKIFTSWDKETGVATCILMDKQGNTYFGQAKCHPEDKDMMSEHTGLEIAYRRAALRYLCHVRNNIIKPELKTLKTFYHSINSNKDYDENHYIVKRLLKHINFAQQDLDDINSEITHGRKELKDYMENKNDFYRSIRKLRMDKFKKALEKKNY